MRTLKSIVYHEHHGINSKSGRVGGVWGLDHGGDYQGQNVGSLKVPSATGVSILINDVYSFG